MQRIKAIGDKYKNIEVAIRKTLLEFSMATHELDKALSSRHPIKELESIKVIRDEWQAAHNQALSVAQQLTKI
ncbi:MAG TPA: hypothetical protein PK263_06115 [bacterium]|nr:hypothetical protein [bacterium]